MKLLPYLFFIALASSLNQNNKNKPALFDSPLNSNDSIYTWTKLLDSADWKRSYNFQMFSIRDTLWVFHFDGT